MGIEEKAKELLDKLPKWNHYIIRDTIGAGQAGAGTKILGLRCDKYSDYAYSEQVTTMREVQEAFDCLVTEAQKAIVNEQNEYWR
jgi:hypothetical protein